MINGEKIVMVTPGFLIMWDASIEIGRIQSNTRIPIMLLHTLGSSLFCTYVEMPSPAIAIPRPSVTMSVPFEMKAPIRSAELVAQ